MILLRSLLWTLFFYLWCVLFAFGLLPLMLAPRRWMIAGMRLWSMGLNEMLPVICGITVEVRGAQHIPAGAGLVAVKHQCMFDTMGTIAGFSDPCWVMKKELMLIPFYGWYSWKGRMIAIDRAAQARALRAMLAAARDRMREQRQLVIAPEGHRQDPGAAPDYKSGIYALYRELGLPCTPMATNAGVCWPAKGFLRRPGTIVFEYLEPIPPGLTRAAFMSTLQERIETASAALLAG